MAPQLPIYNVPENDGTVQVCVQATNVDGEFQVNYNTEPTVPVDAMGGKTKYTHAYFILCMFTNV